MPNKTKAKAKIAAVRSETKAIQRLSEQLKQLKSVKKTPFSDTGGIVGNKIGSFFGKADIGKSVGRWLGSGIGSIFGSGDYTMVGQVPSYNVLASSKQIPQFSTTAATNIVCHREYLGDIQGTSAFTNQSYPLNPGLAQTFPWLSTVAQNYQEYKFHGVVFEFRPLITDFVTNGAPGVIIMSTNYNADSPLYTTKQQMENAEFAVSVKPTLALIHAIECAVNQTTIPHRYVRSGAVPANQDLRLYDYGNFQFATQSNPVQNLGELWVSYCVEFSKPILPATVGGQISTAKYFRSGVTAASPFGTTTTTFQGTLVASFTATTMTFLASPGSSYLINVDWNFPSTAFTFPSVSVSGGTAVAYWNGGGTFIAAPSAAATVTASAAEFYVVKANNLGGNVTVTYSTSGVFGLGPTNMDLMITEIDSSASQ